MVRDFPWQTDLGFDKPGYSPALQTLQQGVTNTSESCVGVGSLLQQPRAGTAWENPIHSVFLLQCVLQELCAGQKDPSGQSKENLCT